MSWTLVLCFILFPVFLPGQTLNKAKIIQIKAERDVVLSYQGKPIPPRLPIWGQEGSMYPAAFVLGHKHPAALAVTVHIPGVKPGLVYSLEGLSADNIPLFSGKPVKVQDETQEIVFEVFAQYEPEGFFKISGENISWQVTGQDTREVSPPLVAPLELYWLYGDTYQFLQKGIPVERLREIADVCNMKGNIQPQQLDTQQKKIKILRDDPKKPAKKWVIASITKHFFNRTPPSYDIWTGSTGFTLYLDQEKRKITFLASSYLNALDDRGAVCCCWDLAVILRYYLHVIGIHDVSLCFMDPFGYLEKTSLVGWGECNNPFFGGTDHHEVVNDKSSHRTAFGNHMFCKLDFDNTIVDITTGPHLGELTPHQYVEAAVDKTFPTDPLVKSGTVNDISYFNTITHVDFVLEPESMDDSEFIDTFKNIVEEKDPGDLGPEKFVVRSWPDPRENRYISRKEWKLSFEQLIPGINGAMKIWKLRKGKKGEAIDIYLYVSSSKSFGARNYFVTRATSHSHHEKPFDKGDSNLGHYSAVNTKAASDNYKMFWVNNNVLFDVTLRNASHRSEKKLFEWFDGLAEAEENLKNSLENDLPPTSGVTCSNPKPRVGETVIVEIGPQTDFIYDFALDGDSLKLTEITGEAFIFKAMKACENTLTVVVVNKHTLISASKTFYINVQH